MTPNRFVLTQKQWEETRSLGHARFVLYVLRLFLRDFLVIEIVTLLLMAFGWIRAYALPIWSELIFFFLIGIGTAEYLWFRMKSKYERR